MAPPDVELVDQLASPSYIDDQEFDEDQDDTANMTEIIADAQRAESNASSTEQTSKPTNSTNGNSKPNAKDPLRPRRKKARRACLACQRAHLTCGDERPCQRCIKRGLQDACHDGVRKKAKYLHDAPIEALNPPGSAGYYMNGTAKSSSTDQSSNVPTNVGSLAQTSHYYGQAQPQTVDLYSPTSSHSQMQQQLHNASFGSSQSPISPQFTATGDQNTSPMQQMNQTSQPMQYGQALFDPSDPALFNLDISSLNFGNQYGASEFAFLHQMASNAYDANGNPVMNSMGQIQDSYNPQYTDGSAILFGQDALMNADWQHSHPRSSSSTTNNIIATPNNTPIVTNIDRQDSMNGMPHGFAIGAGPGSMASASPSSQAELPSLTENQSSPALFMTKGQQQQSSPTFTKPALPHQAQQQQHPVQPPQPPASDFTDSSFFEHVLKPSRKRPHNADYIYKAVNQPYSYTQGFHRLLGYIRTHFSKAKQHRIQKAVSAFRPSLIEFSKNLTNDDLIFMEQGFQRKLYEYVNPVSGFINQYGTPTLLLRRDGSVAAASKEFMILTGWAKNVLTGKEPNLNVNTGGASGASTAPGSAPGSAVRTREGSPKGDGEVGKDGVADGKKAAPSHHSVLIVELFDQDSVVEFYEDFAQLAFNDSHGYVYRRGKLLKYRTKEDMMNIEGAMKREDSPTRVKKEVSGMIGGEAGFNRLGEKEGVVDCTYCWCVDRDIFGIPMLLSMNILPVID